MGRGKSKAQSKGTLTSVSFFENASPSKLANAIEKARKIGTLPDGLNEKCFLQKIFYANNIIDKPTIVSEEEFEKNSGAELYRAVNAIMDENGNVIVSPEKMAKSVMCDDHTRLAGNRANAFGDGLYFAEDRAVAEQYGKHDTIDKTAIMKAKFKKNAKIATEHALVEQLSREKETGKITPELEKTLSDLGVDFRTLKNPVGYFFSRSALSVYALSKGYDAILGKKGKTNILNRSCLIMTEKIEKK